MAREMKDSGVEWIGEIPTTWNVEKLKFCADFITEKYVSGDYQYIGLENIISGSGQYIPTDSQYDMSQTMLFRKGDILFGKLRPYLAKVYLAKEEGCCSGEFCVIRVSQKMDRKFLWALLISPGFIFQVDFSTYGAKMPRANSDFIKNMRIAIPSMPEQHRIASFLDIKCTQVDDLLAKIHTSIEEYKKLKQAVITQAVTKGVRGDRPMKDSGIEWIGKIPQQWSITKVSLVGTTSSGATPLRSNEADFFNDATIRWVRTLDLNDGFVYDSSEKITDLAMKESNCELLPSGTVCVAMYGGAGTIGKCGLLKTVCATNQAICSIVCKPNIIPEYLLYQFLAMKHYWMKFAVGTRKDPNISQDIVGRAKIIVPDIDEQREVIGYLQATLADYDSIIHRKELFLSEMENYKKSLIYEYVTGKKGVEQ